MGQNWEVWINLAMEHWKEFQPTRFEELLEAGKLKETLDEAVRKTSLELEWLEEQGYKDYDAWPMVMDKYLFPPTEQGLPNMEQAYSSAVKLYQDIVDAQAAILRKL